MGAAMTLRVLITGASRGFGASMVAAFASGGARVYAGTRGASAVLGRMRERYPDRVVPVSLDVAREESVAAALSAVSAETDAIDVLLNNAAERSPTVSNPVETIDFRDVARTFDVNAIGPLRVVQAFLPMLRLGASPVLVNVSSEAGSIGQCWRDRELDYAMSKAALNMATAILANYLRGTVRVFSLHPGWLRTDMGGPKAALDPDAVAQSAASLIVREAKNLGGPRFLDHEGSALAW
jgi:NAD(P)-dependent dehydrogenase (short-subunit alcohol dehydrogenase family)